MAGRGAGGTWPLGLRFSGKWGSGLWELVGDTGEQRLSDTPVPPPQRDAQDPSPGALPSLSRGRAGARVQARTLASPSLCPLRPGPLATRGRPGPRAESRLMTVVLGGGLSSFPWGTGARVTLTTAARGLAHQGFARAQPGDRGSLRPLGKRQAPAKWGSQARTLRALGQALEGGHWSWLGATGPHARRLVLLAGGFCQPGVRGA